MSSEGTFGTVRGPSSTEGLADAGGGKGRVGNMFESGTDRACFDSLGVSELDLVRVAPPFGLREARREGTLAFGG